MPSQNIRCAGLHFRSNETVFFGASYLLELATSEPVILSRIPLIFQARPLLSQLPCIPLKEIVVSVRSSIVSGVVGSKPVTVFFCKSTIMPMFYLFGGLRPAAPLGSLSAFTRQRQRRVGCLCAR